MSGIWSICVGAAMILPVSVVPLTTGPALADQKGESVPMVQQWSGHYSAQDAAKRVVVRDTEGWKQLWRAVHGRTSPMPDAPEVDFREHMVIGVFMGTRPSGGYSISMTGIVQNEKITVTVREQSPDPDDMVTMALTTPYHVAVVPRSEKPVEFVADPDKKRPGPPRSRGLLK